MKLSEIKGERAIECIADIIEPIISISQDKAALDLFRGIGSGGAEHTAASLGRAVPALLRSHKREVIAVLAAIEGISAEQYVKKTDLVTMIKSLTELVTDDVFIELFTSAQSGANSLGSAPSNIESPDHGTEAQPNLSDT